MEVVEVERGSERGRNPKLELAHRHRHRSKVPSSNTSLLTPIQPATSLKHSPTWQFFCLRGGFELGLGEWNGTTCP
jgi:hypothetical protein